MKEIDRTRIELEGAYLKREPHWWLRYGMLLVFGFFILLLILAMAIPYPDTLTAKAILQTERPSATIRAKETHRIKQLWVNAGDTVHQGELLALLENTASLTDIQQLKQHLEEETAFQGNSSTYSEEQRTLQLGAGMQSAFQQYVRTAQDVSRERYQNNDSLLTLDWQQRLAQAQAALERHRGLLQISMQNKALAQKTFDRFQGLHGKGVISDQEMESRQKEYLTAVRQWQRTELELQRLQAQMSQLRSEELLAKNAVSNGSAQRTINRDMARQQLWTAIQNWEEQYLLKSPIQGRVALTGVWKANQYIGKGQPVLTIVPLDSQDWFARCTVPLRNAGKLKKGQKVRIELENYPSREWGFLQGHVHAVAEVPIDGHYTVWVTLNDQETSFGLPPVLAQLMEGQAKIVLEDTSLLERIFQKFRYALHNESRQPPNTARE